MISVAKIRHLNDIDKYTVDILEEGNIAIECVILRDTYEDAVSACTKITSQPGEPEMDDNGVPFTQIYPYKYEA